MTLKEITNTLPASLIKGAAANLAIQAIGKNLNKKTFLPTLLVGAVGGELSCLSDNKYLSTIIAASVFGGGNALANKASLPRTMLKYAAIGTAGRLMLNIPAAVAKRDTKWIVLEDYHLPKGNLNPKSQWGDEAGCAQATFDSIAEYLGITPTTDFYNDGYDFSILCKKNGFNAYDLSKSEVDGKKKNIPWSVGNYLRMGCPAALTYNNSGVKHIVGINRIIQEKQTIVDKNGNKTEKIRWRIEVMDPIAYGNLVFIPYDEFERGLVTIVKP